MGTPKNRGGAEKLNRRISGRPAAVECPEGL
jgi:hypothetical protein